MIRVRHISPLVCAAALLVAAGSGRAAAADITFSMRTLDDGLGASAAPLYTTVDNPANHTVTPPSALDGVARLIISRTDGNFLCSGALLNGGTQVLTAAHCVAEGTGGALNTNGSSITFYVAGGPVSITGASIAVNPGWNGDATAGNDLAIITLSTPAVGVQTYGLYTGSDELGKVGVKAGFGKTGTGATGDTGASGTEHTGQNLYDAYSSIFNVVPGFGPAPVGAGLAYDFDNGLAANDAFGFFFGLNNPDTALVNANQEVMAAPGDSGGPTFIDGLIAGITSYGLTLAFSNGSTSDINTTANDASYGEFGVDTRVSYYQDWIYSVVGYPAASIPEPGSGAALAAGILMLLRRRLKASSPL